MALIDRLKFDFPKGVLAYKWPSENLTVGAQLIVNESQEALFFKSGKALDLFGPGTHTLSSANLPFLQKLINLPFGGQTPFAAEVYFINKNVEFSQDWGTKTPIMLLDPRYRVTIPIRSYGQYAIRIENSREFILNVVGTSPGALANSTATNMLSSPIISCIQQGLSDFMIQNKITALELPGHTMALVDHVIRILSSRYKTFGVGLVNFTIESINFDPKDESVSKLRAILDESARLEIVGEAFRKNQDFYRTERQFDVMQSASESSSPIGGVMGAALGIGMGFGAAGSAGDIAKQAMAKENPSNSTCPKCNSQCKLGSKFCDNCGGSLVETTKICINCKAENSKESKYCFSCGTLMGIPKCSKCNADLIAGAKFCNQCGSKT